MSFEQPRIYTDIGLTAIRVVGKDAIKVLNGLCTAKLVDLHPGCATETFFTDDRGRILAHGMVAWQLDGMAVWVVGLIPNADQLVAHIDRFIFREDASPGNQTAKWSAWLLDQSTGSSALRFDDAQCSPVSLELSCFGVDARPGSSELDSVEPDGCCPITIGAALGWLISLPITSAKAKLCLTPVESRTATENAFRHSGVRFASHEEFELARIVNFWPMAGEEISDRTLPQELDRDGFAISFTKGCYLGQETVARLDAMGQVQKKLCLVEIHGSNSIQAGLSLWNADKSVGQLCSAAAVTMADGSNPTRTLALAMMRRGFMAPGCKFEVRADGQTACLGNGQVLTKPQSTCVPSHDERQ